MSGNPEEDAQPLRKAVGIQPASSLVSLLYSGNKSTRLFLELVMWSVAKTAFYYTGKEELEGQRKEEREKGVKIKKQRMFNQRPHKCVIL